MIFITLGEFAIQCQQLGSDIARDVAGKFSCVQSVNQSKYFPWLRNGAH